MNYKSKKLSSSDNLISQSDLHSIKITVTPHGSYNSSQGVIYETDLDLLEGMRDQDVTVVKIITTRRDGEEVKTKHVILISHQRRPLQISFTGTSDRTYQTHVAALNVRGMGTALLPAAEDLHPLSAQNVTSPMTTVLLTK